jgi:hypothetical protein
MQKVILSLSAAVLLGCASTPSDEADPTNSVRSYRETNATAQAGFDEPVWSSNPKKPTLVKEIEEAVEK